ncbi:1652_t:CDS:2, partial [Entrophospora sp. SA101]
LTIEEKVLLSPSSGSNNSFHLDLAKQKILTEVDYVSSPVSIPTANKDISSLDNAIPSVAQLANSALVEICEAIENYDNHDVVESLTPILLANSPSSVTDTLAISDHASITSGSSTEKNIHIKNNSKWGVSFEDKRQLSLSLLNASSVLSTNEVTATIFTPSSSSSNFSGANKTLSLFTDGASKKLLDINNNVISGGNFFDRSMRSISNGPVKSNTLGSSSPIVAPK